MLKTLSRLLAGATLIAVVPLAAAQGKLTILWAQWDPANYLQELVKDYEKQTGVKVTVETTPWPDFQTKAFKEFNAKGSAYDMVVGDSQWLGAGSTGGHYVDLTDFFKKYKVAETMAPATVKGYAEYPGNSGKYWAIPLEGDATGFAYRKDWFEDPKEMAAFKAKYKYDLGVPKTWNELADIAEFFHRPKEKRYGLTIYTDNSYDALAMGVENVIFSYGGELGNFATNQVAGIINSKENIEALDFYKRLYGYTPPDWGKAFFQEANQAMTEGLAAMSMNFFAFFPALANPATNKYAKQTGYFAMPKGPTGKQFHEVPRVVRPRGRAEEVGRARRLHLQRRDPQVRRLPQGDALQRGLLPVDVHGQGLLGRARVRGAADCGEQALASLRGRRQRHRRGGDERAGEGLGGDLQEVRARQVAPPHG
jgi:multiple sugar transport system substrate-binding protein